MEINSAAWVIVVAFVICGGLYWLGGERPLQGKQEQDDSDVQTYYLPMTEMQKETYITRVCPYCECTLDYEVWFRSNGLLQGGRCHRTMVRAAGREICPHCGEFLE